VVAVEPIPLVLVQVMEALVVAVVLVPTLAQQALVAELH
jgi:hypothetical protein